MLYEIDDHLLVTSEQPAHARNILWATIFEQVHQYLDYQQTSIKIIDWQHFTYYDSYHHLIYQTVGSLCDEIYEVMRKLSLPCFATQISHALKSLNAWVLDR